MKRMSVWRGFQEEMKMLLLEDMGFPINEVSAANNVISTDMCVRDGETANHLLIHCDVAWRIWGIFLKDWNIKWATPPDIITLISSWPTRSTSRRNGLVLKVLPAAIIWNLWEERNLRAFQGVSKEVMGIVDVVKLTVAYWLHNRGVFKDSRTYRTGKNQMRHQFHSYSKRKRKGEPARKFQSSPKPETEKVMLTLQTLEETPPILSLALCTFGAYGMCKATVMVKGHVFVWVSGTRGQDDLKQLRPLPMEFAI
ncbi:hypothetical protein C5167_040215 [Papaver somniferum]|uniref:Reverse transcriptase zinc-binding domain-containing protein n=1 Tax=Papaver somniferum TaxID=3469 RepID=A0A4Y7IIK8_PAPSO|nr:hypothetical protein C5167_040215 [Papaver somniferum]